MDSNGDPALPSPNLPKRSRIDAHEEEGFGSSAPVQAAAPYVFPNVPDELCFEIFSRLPAKSLGRFERISKPWKSLISNPNFIKAHLRIACGRDDLGHKGIIFRSNSPSHIKKCSVSSVVDPATGEAFTSTELSDTDYPMKDTENQPTRFDIFGFGYDELNDDYKAVRVHIPSGLDVTEVRVYSLKNDSWSPVGLEKDIVPSGFYSGQYANGNLHWVMTLRGNNEWKFSGLIWRVRDLGKSSGQKHGVEDSWTKLVSVPYIDYPEDFSSSLPVCMLSNGDILLIIRSMLVLYSPKSNTFRWYPRINKIDEVSIFIESFVSPDFHDGEQGPF
ncbi:OLC1v1019299C1 [Oldenlandia corymbosa var. corymbosa]|uniref:OLC1v1019299C1 n=1 Tax=Oldenlandia corymbosa var. corymbosa TaxID=529605 RepID=A0AAV1EDQ3_OLDCO|nr:OLC1v1019299C1 [Oldenlandia corymbosa var. corymbosa]